MTPFFSSVRQLRTAIVGVALLLVSATAVQAQVNNLPYQLGNAGLSYAGRQAILNDKLLNSRPKNLVRGIDGSLLDVSRRDNQAFLRSPQTGAILPGGSPRRGWATGLGTGLGWGGSINVYSAALSYRYARPGESMMQWISMLDMGPSRAYGSYSVSDSESPIDQWTAQTDPG